MQLGHAHRRLLSRCILRSYSVRTTSATVASPVSPRPRRPFASNFQGIDIENVHSASQKPRTRTDRPPQSNGPSDPRRKGHFERRGAAKGGAPSISGWSDGLVSLSFSSRLKLRQEKKTNPSYTDAQSWDEYPKPAYRPQMHARRSVQREQGDASRAPHHAERKKSPARQRTRAPATTDAEPESKYPKPAHRPQMHARRSVQREQGDTPRAPHHAERKKSSARQRTRALATTDAEPESKATSMTRPSSTSKFKLHGQQPTTKPATGTRITKAASPRVVSKTTKADPPAPSLTATTAGQSTSTSTAGRNPRLTTALTSTNLNALFRMRDAPIAGIPLPVHASMSARVRSVLERRAGDYSRFLPHRVGVRKDASRPPALRTARHALSAQRDVNLDQRRLALHIIEGLVQPQRQVRA